EPQIFASRIALCALGAKTQIDMPLVCTHQAWLSQTSRVRAPTRLLRLDFVHTLDQRELEVNNRDPNSKNSRNAASFRIRPHRKRKRNAISREMSDRRLILQVPRHRTQRLSS